MLKHFQSLLKVYILSNFFLFSLEFKLFFNPDYDFEFK